MPQKIVIIGAGSVGATFAYALMQGGQAREIVLIDSNIERAKGEVMDLQHGLAFTRPVNIRYGDYTECSNADVVVITAGAKQNPGESRLSLAGRNAGLLKQIIPSVLEKNFGGVLLIVSNPVDVLTHIAWKISGLPAGRVIGSGTVLDSARLRSLLSESCGVDARNIHAMIIGEHGDSEVAAWSLVRIGGLPIREYCSTCILQEDKVNHFQNIFKEVKHAAYEIINRKGATFYAVGLALVQITDAILRDEHRILPVSSVIPDLYGMGQATLSLPSIIGRSGVERILMPELESEELKALHESAKTINKSVESIMKGNIQDSL